MPAEAARAGGHRRKGTEIWKFSYYLQPTNFQFYFPDLAQASRLCHIGFVYIYISNESESTSQIYWDDFKVTHSYHTKTQEDDYYPFGMRHTKRYTDTPENRHLFNSGSEFNAKLGVYETPFRQYDPVLGRFNGIDAMASNFNSMSPYQFGSNSPAMANDPTGLYPSWYTPGMEAEFAQAANEGGMSGLSGVNSRGGWGDMGDAFWDGWGEKAGGNYEKSDKAKERKKARKERRSARRSNIANWINSDSRVSAWMKNNLPGVIAAPLAGITELGTGITKSLLGILIGDGNAAVKGLKDAGLGVLTALGFKEALTEKWVAGPTGGILPSSLSIGVSRIGKKVPLDAGKNGMHAWHAGTNAYLSNHLGPIGSVLVFLGGVIHETPIDFQSFRAEQKFQGTWNHIMDSSTDILANGFGVIIGLLLPKKAAEKIAIKLGNQIPGPGDPDPAFGGGGAYKFPRIWDAWFQIPKW